MGLPIACLRILLKEASRRPFQGKILALGRQNVQFDEKTLQRLASEYGVTLKIPRRITPPLREKYARKGLISDEHLFLSLGFSEFHALDYSDYEGAQIIFDLNQPSPPKNLLESFDVILDSGTLEHVFHVPNALCNISRMLRPDGRIIQFLPSSNYMDHGFYMFSPTVLYEYYSQNNFQIDTSQITRTTPPPMRFFKTYNYTPGSLQHLSLGGLDSSVYGIVNIVTKKENSTYDKIPQQKMYQTMWGGGKLGNPVSLNDPILINRFRQPLKDVAKKSVFLHKNYVRFFRKKGLGLKVEEDFKEF